MEETVMSETHKARKLLSVILTLVMLIPVMAAFTVTSYADDVEV